MSSGKKVFVMYKLYLRGAGGRITPGKHIYSQDTAKDMFRCTAAQHINGDALTNGAQHAACAATSTEPTASSPALRCAAYYRERCMPGEGLCHP